MTPEEFKQLITALTNIQESLGLIAFILMFILLFKNCSSDTTIDTYSLTRELKLLREFLERKIK